MTENNSTARSKIRSAVSAVAVAYKRAILDKESVGGAKVRRSFKTFVAKSGSFHLNADLPVRLIKVTVIDYPISAFYFHRASAGPVKLDMVNANRAR